MLDRVLDKVLDIKDAPEGYYPVEIRSSTVCYVCHLTEGTDTCVSANCAPGYRRDGKFVVFKEKPPKENIPDKEEAPKVIEGNPIIAPLKKPTINTTIQATNLRSMQSIIDEYARDTIESKKEIPTKPKSKPSAVIRGTKFSEMFTEQQYNIISESCTKVFQDKAEDYGTSWRVLRPSSLTDQIFIKANRLQTLQIAGNAKVDESQEDAFIGIVNYSIMAMIQLDLQLSEKASTLELLGMYAGNFNKAFTLMQAKNHDYGEAWRSMRISSLTDLILMKLLRVKQIEDNNGETKVSEGLEANYMDILNYAVFALIKLKESIQE